MRIALAKGRLFEPAVARFRQAGAELAAEPGRRLLIPSSDPTIEFLVVKPGDVPVYVESGAADLGVTGTDVLREIDLAGNPLIFPDDETLAKVKIFDSQALQNQDYVERWQALIGS